MLRPFFSEIATFFVLAVVFAIALTGVVRLAGMRVRTDLSGRLGLALTLAFVGVLLLGWWMLTRGETIEERVLAPLILPAPAEVVLSLPKLHFEQGLVRSIGTSFWRVTAGFALAAIVAVPLGVYMATFAPVAAFFRPLALMGSYVPIVVFIPLTLAWFGLTEMQKVGFLFIGCFVALLPMVIKTISDVPPAYLDVAVTKGASQWQLVREVLFPVAKADIWDHLRGVYGVGWGWIILAEVVNAQQGLGYLISISERRGHTASIFAIIIVIVAIAVACDQIWRLTGRLLFPYRYRS
jgi:NitT/TauT family transport system permease protein